MDLAVGVATLITAIAAIGVSIYALKSQQKHERVSARPLGYLDFSDYENDIGVAIENHGTGPMTVSKCEFTRLTEKNESLRNVLPSISMPWRDYTDDVGGRPIRPGARLVLVQMVNPNADTRSKLREALSNVNCEIENMDMHKISAKVPVRDWKYFSRPTQSPAKGMRTTGRGLDKRRASLGLQANLKGDA
jgi:hypothetical protein